MIRIIALLLLTCIGALAQGGSYCTMSTWEPRNIATKAGLVASYDPGNTNTLVFNGSGISAMSNRVSGTAALLQGTALNQPYLTNTLGGRPTLHFDGTAHYLKTATFTYNQPEELYILWKPIGYTLNDQLLDGLNVTHRMYCAERLGVSNIRLYAGTYGPTNLITTNIFAVSKLVFVGANSFIQQNLDTPSVVADVGAQNGSGITLGALYDGTDAWMSMDFARMLACNKTNAPAESGYLRWGMLKQASLY